MAGAADGFLPRVIYGVIRMEFFQFAGEMGSACVSHAAVGVPPNAFMEEVHIET